MTPAEIEAQDTATLAAALAEETGEARTMRAAALDAEMHAAYAAANVQAYTALLAAQYRGRE